MVEFEIFGVIINTKDTEIAALKAAMAGINKRQLMDRWGFDKNRASKVYQAKSITNKINEALNKDGAYEVTVKQNGIIEKIFSYICQEPNPLYKITKITDQAYRIEKMDKNTEPQELQDNVKGEIITEKNRKIKVTPEVVERVLTDYITNGIKNISKLADMHGLSMTTCDRICRRDFYRTKYPEVYKAIKETNIADTQDADVSDDASTDNSDLIKDIDIPEVPLGAYWVPCVLVADRHEMPVKVSKAIFKYALSPELMSNFDGIDGVINTFIDNVFKGKNHGIQCYVTGIQAPLAALVKICCERKINLILMHYNPTRSTYETQYIWTEFEGYVDPARDISYAYDAFLRAHQYAKIYNSDLSKISDCYIVTRCLFSAVNDSVINRTGYITSSKEDAIKLYSEMVVKMALEGIANVSIFVEKVKFSQDGFYKKERMCKSQNF